MAAYALLIGTKGGKRELLADGPPPVVRKAFRESDGAGCEMIEVIDTNTGRTRRKKFVVKPQPAKKRSRKVPSEDECL